MKYNNIGVYLWIGLSITFVVVNLFFGLGFILGSWFWDNMVINKNPKGEKNDR